MLEHSRRSEHEGITECVRNVAERFENLEGSERVRNIIIIIIIINLFVILGLC